MSRADISLNRFAEDKLAELEARQQRRRLDVSDNTSGMRVRRGGRDFVNFCSNDYLGLSQHPAVLDAARNAVTEYGAGSGASRLVTGGYSALFELEAKLAAFKGTEDCVVFGSGYMANLAITPALVGAGDLILIDALAHACLFAGAQLSRARPVRFAHNDMGDLRRLLEKHRAGRERAIILTDGVFSMDGDIAPLPELLALAEAFDAWTLVDDAHGLGVLGRGKGTAHSFTSPAAAPLQMGTLSKSLGSYGGYLCASRAVCELLRSRARPLVFTTAPPPASIGAALKALELIETGAVDTDRPLALARRFCRSAGLAEPATPIVPVILGAEEHALRASRELNALGFLVTAIRPPTVPDGTARLRITFSATHDEADVDVLAAAVAELRQNAVAAE